MNAGDGEPASGSSAVLDRIEWPVTFSVLAYGVRFGVRTNDSHLAEALPHRLPPGWQPVELCDTGRVYSLMTEGDDPPRSSVYVNDAVLARRVPIPAALRAFQADVQLYVAEMAPERVFVHAGVVGYRGRAIVLPGRSFAGKTTLVGELIRAGTEYYSDEYAVLDSAGVVHPYPRPPSIRRSGSAVTKHRADDWDGRAGSDPLPVGLVVVCNYRSGAEWQPQSLSPGQGIQALFANTVPARRIPETVLATLHQVVSVARVVASDRGEASSVVEPILKLVFWG